MPYPRELLKKQLEARRNIVSQFSEAALRRLGRPSTKDKGPKQVAAVSFERFCKIIKNDPIRAMKLALTANLRSHFDEDKT